ncbi:uncharacterized protein [Lolium perenne]|uniref:uncharacterized protein isoform X1 n=1 Tax=Lolium perenne TaxID=4522 RepID=UPI003A99C007
MAISFSPARRHRTLGTERRGDQAGAVPGGATTAVLGRSRLLNLSVMARASSRSRSSGGGCERPRRAPAQGRGGRRELGKGGRGELRLRLMGQVEQHDAGAPARGEEPVDRGRRATTAEGAWRRCCASSPAFSTRIAWFVSPCFFSVMLFRPWCWPCSTILSFCTSWSRHLRIC